MQSQDKLLPLYAFSGEHLGTISLEKAYSALANDEATLRWKGLGRKARVTAVYLNVRKLTYRPATTITLAETENNAFVQAFADHLPLTAKDSIRVLDRATEKVENWKDVHDDKAVVISGGIIHGAKGVEAFEDRVLSFA